jgi:hypothetical protein
MSVRTTAEAVGGIIKVVGTVSMTPFIEAANALVTEHCSEDDYDATRLELIERWLAAHFYAIYEPRRLSERAGPVSKQIESRVDLGFDVTRYGQMAMRFDTEGGLAALNEQIKSGGSLTVGVTWLGSEDEYSQDEE